MMPLSYKELVARFQAGPPKAPKANRSGRRAMARELMSHWLVIPNPKAHVVPTGQRKPDGSPELEVRGGKVLSSGEIRATFDFLRRRNFPHQFAQ